MALVYIDSFDHIDSGESKWYRVNILTSTASGRTGYAASGGAKTLPGEYTSMLAGIAFRSNNLGAANNPFTFWNARTTNTVVINILSDGRLYISSARPGAFTNETHSSSPSTGFIVNNQWYYLELYATTTTSYTTYELHVNEESWLAGTFTFTSAPAQAVGTIGYADITISAAGGGNTNYYDDFYVRSDGTFHGDVDVICLRPNGTTTLSEWTPSTATNNYLMVDDTVPDEDTSYVLATTTGLTDLYEMEDVGAFTGLIFGVQGVQDIKKVEAGEGRTVQVWVDGVTGTDTWTSNEFYPSALDYLFHIVTLETNPWTSGTWSSTDVDALRFGVERVL